MISVRGCLLITSVRHRTTTNTYLAVAMTHGFVFKLSTSGCSRMSAAANGCPGEAELVTVIQRGLVKPLDHDDRLTGASDSTPHGALCRSKENLPGTVVR
jgi:hypothetical protein